MKIEITDINQVNPFARSDGMPLEGKLKEYDQWEQAMAAFKFSLLSPSEKEAQKKANEHMAKKMGG